jgi:hypothetical protein
MACPTRIGSQGTTCTCVRTVALTIGVRTEPAKTSLERTHFAGIVPHGALVDEHDPAERQLRPRIRRAGWVPVARRRDGLLGLAATARIIRMRATPHRFCARVVILVSRPGGEPEWHRAQRWRNPTEVSDPRTALAGSRASSLHLHLSCSHHWARPRRRPRHKIGCAGLLVTVYRWHPATTYDGSSIGIIDGARFVLRRVCISFPGLCGLETSSPGSIFVPVL